MTVSSTAAKPAAFRTVSEGRLTVYLTPELVKAVKVKAAYSGESASALVTRAVLELLTREPFPGYEPPEGSVAKGAAVLKRVREQYRQHQRATPDNTPAQALKRARELKRQRATQSAIADTLNREGYKTARGKRWNVVSVGRMLRAK